MALATVAGGRSRHAQPAARAALDRGSDAAHRRAARSSPSRAPSRSRCCRDLPERRTCCARCARSSRVRSIEAIPERGLYLRVIVPVNVLTIADDIRVLQVLQRVPTAIARDAELVEEGLQRLPAAAARARGPEAHLRPHAHARDAAHALLGAGARLRALRAALGAAVRARRGHARDRQGRLLEAEPGEEPRRVRRAHAVVQHDDAPDRRRHRGDGAQPAAAGERQDLPREHPVEPHLGRAHVRRAPVREDDERRGERHPRGARRRLPRPQAARVAAPRAGGGAVRRDRAAPLRLVRHAASGKSRWSTAARRASARCCCAARAWASAATTATWWCSTTSRT